MRKTIDTIWEPCGVQSIGGDPRLYRNRFGRDVYKDLMTLNDAISDKDENASTLDNFQTFSIYQILPQLIDLWGMNLKIRAI